MRSAAVLLVAIAVSGTACNPNQPITEAFNRLHGTWIENRDGHASVEVWEKGKYGLADGYAYTLTGSDSSFDETLSIAATDSGIFYIAVVRGQNNNQPVFFRLTAHSGNIIRFENPRHDFPNRLTYRFVADDSLYVTVAGKSRSFDIQYRRQKENR